MATTILMRRVLEFQSKAVSNRTLDVHFFRGTEEISNLFRFDLELHSRKIDLDLEAILQEPASFGMRQQIQLSDGPGSRMIWVHGMLSAFEQLEKGLDCVRYRAVLVPRLWRLSLTTRSRVFLDRTALEIVKEVLEEHGFVDGEDFELRRISRPGAKREQVVQYQESDLLFVHRLLEHEGIFYFFDHQDGRDKAVFADAPTAFAPVASQPTIQYRDVLAADPQVESIETLSARHQPVPAQVILQDYNYRAPEIAMTVSAPVDPAGSGTIHLYGEHYPDPGEGKTIAKIRAEEIACRKVQFSGRGNVRGLQAGALFELAGHYRADFNARFVVVSISHEGTQGQSVTASEALRESRYANDFVAIPSDAPFRPPRVTPRPRIPGTMHARVDAAGDGTYAELDSEGRYKVLLPFDLSGRKDGRATKFVRMAQPYSGGDYGMHFPLHKGSEIVLTHIDGDPDRPMIAAAVPNPSTKSPVRDENQTQCVVRTGSKNEWLIEDRQDRERIRISTPRADSFLQLGHEHDRPHAIHTGASLSTRGTVTVHAKESVVLGSGFVAPDEARDKTVERVNEVVKAASDAAKIAAAVGQFTADRLKDGLDVAGAAADVLGVVAGRILPNTVVSAEGRLSCVSGGHTLVASAAALDLVALGNAHLLAGVHAQVAAGDTVSVAAGRHLQMGANKEDVEITSRERDILVDAKKNFRLDAREEDIALDANQRNFTAAAEKDVSILARKGKGTVTIRQELHIESVEKKEIVLRAGRSTITIRDHEIVIEAPQIHVKSTEAKAQIDMGQAPIPFKLVSSDGIVQESQGRFLVSSARNVVWLEAKDKVAMTAPVLDTTAVPVHKHRHYTQG